MHWTLKEERTWFSPMCEKESKQNFFHLYKAKSTQKSKCTKENIRLLSFFFGTVSALNMRSTLSTYFKWTDCIVIDHIFLGKKNLLVENVSSNSMEGTKILYGVHLSARYCSIAGDRKPNIKWLMQNEFIVSNKRWGCLRHGRVKGQVIFY